MSDLDFLTTLRSNLLATQGMQLGSLEPGTQIGEDYVLGEKINEGGSGSIYMCTKKSDQDKIYALKVCMPQSANAARRFQAEVTASYQVRHPNVLRSIDCFFHGKALTYVMEYAPGGDLRDILESDKEVPIETIVILARQLCSGLSAIHNSGIIHRDIKPENILFSSTGKVKIADFGISFTSELTRVTHNGSLVGTINYMAPEYVERGIFDPRSDLFSLGVMLYELLARQLPFGSSKTLDDLLNNMVSGFIPVSEKRAECPYQLSNVISKLLALVPEHRFQTASEVELELIAIERDLLGSQSGGSETEGEEDVTVSVLKKNRYTKKNYFGLIVFLLVTVIVVSATLVFVKKFIPA